MSKPRGEGYQEGFSKGFGWGLLGAGIVFILFFASFYYNQSQHDVKVRAVLEACALQVGALTHDWIYLGSELNEKGQAEMSFLVGGKKQSYPLSKEKGVIGNVMPRPVPVGSKIIFWPKSPWEIQNINSANPMDYLNLKVR